MAGERFHTDRRTFLKGSGASATALVAGCLGDSGPDASTDEGPETPWTTEDLLDAIDGDETLTIYAGTGDDSQWYDLIDVINDEFGTNLEGDVFAGAADDVNQRFIQERQANEPKVEILSNVGGIPEEIKIEGLNEGEDAANEVASQYFEMGVHENFWFKDLLGDWQLKPFMIPAYNGGANLTFPYNRDLLDDAGVEPPGTYNDLLDDQYEGMTMLIPGYVIATYAGWVIKSGASESSMDNMAWMDALKDHLNFEGVNSYTTAVRRIANGNAPMMIYNFPNVIQAFITESPALEGSFPGGGFWPASAGPLHINKDAPQPWVARFFASAVLEEPVQKRILSDVYTQVPVRTDIDYSNIETNPYNRKRIDIDSEQVGFYETAEYTTVGREARNDGKFEPA